MLTVITLFFGLVAMLGLWWSAWWVLRQPLRSPLSESSPHAPVWQNEPTPAREPAPAPPGWIFDEKPAAPATEPVGEESDAKARPRARPSSGAKTQFFNRSDLRHREVDPEKTEILNDEELNDEPTNSASAPSGESPPPLPAAEPTGKWSRKTWRRM
jgi:hypothetical protein